MHLLRPGVLEHADDLAGRVSPHDRVVDHHHPLVGDDLGQRVELHPQPALAELLSGLDEGPGDVAVLDQPVVLGDAGRPREAVRRRIAGVRHRDHQVGIHRSLPPQDLAHPAAHLLEHPSLQPGVRAGEVDVLEHALRAAARRGRPDGPRSRPPSARSARPGATSRISSAADDVEGAALRGDHVAVAQLADRERAHAVRGRGTRPRRASSSPRSNRRPEAGASRPRRRSRSAAPPPPRAARR